jgi:hypothetical protein
VKHAVAVLLLMGAAAPAASAELPPAHLYVIGDSLARYNSPYLHAQLPHWKIEENFSFARTAIRTARDLSLRARTGPALAPVIVVSAGAGDDPEHPERFRRAIRRVMRVAGPTRCVVWANVWRPRFQDPTFDVLNLVLAEEDGARANLRVIDWHAMVEAHSDWLIDLIHVNEEGNVARADAIAREVRACRWSGGSALTPGPLPA